VFSILLFPIGLAVVELARVPLAIAVRTQNSWSVKLFAAMGVLADQRGQAPRRELAI
jgi:hypothetical protein